MTTNHGIYGYLAGMISAAVLQPFQNIKMAIILPPSHLKLSNNFIINIGIASRYIYRQGGLKQFYDGLVSNVLKTGTSSGVYFFTMRKLEQILPKNSAASNFLASSMGRIASSLVANPLSVLQTRYQLSGQAKWQGSIINSMKRIYVNQGINGFYKGAIASCYKQGSFAGLYYMLYVTGKQYGLSSLVSGMISGLFSTAITHPFQIIRASLQGNCNKQDKNPKIFQHLKQLVNKGELLKGVTPRLVKKPLSNTISFIIFQAMERTDQQNVSKKL